VRNLQERRIRTVSYVCEAWLYRADHPRAAMQMQRHPGAARKRSTRAGL